MNKQIGRNDPCPCGSGKKYKACCWNKQRPTGKKQFSAKLLSGKVNLIERAFGSIVQEDKPLEKVLGDHVVVPEIKKSEVKMSEE